MNELSHVSCRLGLLQAFELTSSRATSRTDLADVSMKIFDWKKREAFQSYEIPEGMNTFKVRFAYFNFI